MLTEQASPAPYSRRRASHVESGPGKTASRSPAACGGGTLLIEVEGVRKAFPGVVALDDVSFRLRAGTVHALMGENGAGKSTLMKILAGVYIPDKGSYQLHGREIALTSPLDALENGIAMIHQELNLMPFMSIAENIWIRREPLNRFGLIDHAKMYQMTRELFARLSIELDPEAKVASLSISSRQMVEIARAVSYNSDVLIMDEPTSALTEHEVAHLFRIVRMLREQGKGIIYITHKMNELFEIADEVSVFRDGHFIGCKRVEQLTHDEVIRMMVGREITEMFPKTIVPIGEVALEVEHLTLDGVFHDVSFSVRQGKSSAWQA
jgi:inositol transport system ATP-binding protein